MDKEKIKSTFKKSGVKTETIKEKVLKRTFGRKHYIKSSYTTLDVNFVSKIIDLTIEECKKSFGSGFSKRRLDSLIDEAREIMKNEEPFKLFKLNPSDQSNREKCFIRRILKLKKSGEK